MQKIKSKGPLNTIFYFKKLNFIYFMNNEVFRLNHTFGNPF